MTDVGATSASNMGLETAFHCSSCSWNDAGQKSGIIRRKVRWHSRVFGAVRGQRLPLYLSEGFHLRLPTCGERFVYVYIRKNGCSSFKRWMLDALGNNPSSRAEIDYIASRRNVSFSSELNDARTILVIRDPLARICSVFRNKFIQGKGAKDIRASVQLALGKPADEVTYRDFVLGYIGTRMQPAVSSKWIDPHCATQASHLWPIRYDHIIALENLSEVAVSLFGSEIGKEFFGERVNASSSKMVSAPAASVPARELSAEYRSTGKLPTNESLLDQMTQEALTKLYTDDFELIEHCFGGGVRLSF